MKQLSDRLKTKPGLDSSENRLISEAEQIDTDTKGMGII
jgi:hypothetical protein